MLETVLRCSDVPYTGSAAGFTSLHTRSLRWKAAIYQHNKHNLSPHHFGFPTFYIDLFGTIDSTVWDCGEVVVCWWLTVSKAKTSIAVPPPNTYILSPSVAISCRYLEITPRVSVSVKNVWNSYISVCVGLYICYSLKAIRFKTVRHYVLVYECTNTRQLHKHYSMTWRK